MTGRPSSSNKTQNKPAKSDAPNQKYNKAEILNICNKTDKKCFEDMVKRFEDKQNQSSIKSISAAGSSSSNKSSCSMRHSFHTIQSPGAKKPMRNCKSLNFENSKQFTPNYNNSHRGGGGGGGGTSNSGRTHHTKSIESKTTKNNSHMNVYKMEQATEKLDRPQSNCSTARDEIDEDDGIVDFDDGSIQVNMTTIGEYNAFEVSNENLCYHDKFKANPSPDDSLEKGVREETRLSGVKILLRGDILGAINCLLPQLNLMRSVNLRHCKDEIIKAREYRKQIFEINKTKNLHVTQEHEYNIEKQGILKTLENSICDVIDAKEIANAEKIFENYKIPSQTFIQSSSTVATSSCADNGKRNKSTCKCKTQAKHSQRHDAKKPQSAPSALVEENVKNNNLKLQQKCKKSNLANSHRDKRKQQAKKIIFTTFFKNSNLDKATDEKSVKNVWENSSAKFTKFTDSESSSVLTISEDEVHIDVCTSSTKSVNGDVVKGVEEVPEKKIDFDLIKKIARQLQDWCDEKRKSNVAPTSKMSAASKQDQGKRTYSSVLKCSSAEKKTEKRKNSVKAKNKMTALSVNQKKENSKENQLYVSSAAAVASAPAVLENSNETRPEQKKIEKPFCVHSSSSTTSINHEHQTNHVTTPVLDENNNNNGHLIVPSLFSEEDILLQLEKRIVYDLESILNACDDDDDRFFCTNSADDKNVAPQSTAASLSLSNNLKQYNQLIDQINYTRLVQNMILPQFAAGYSAIANQYNYFWPMNNIMYSRNVIANYPQLFQHSIVLNRNAPITTAAATISSAINDTTKLEATLNELNSLKRNCQNNNQLTDSEFRDVIMYQNKNFDSHGNFSNGTADEINSPPPPPPPSGASKMISVSDLESEALEQYKHSDDSLNKKFDVLEKEAEEQYDGYE